MESSTIRPASTGRRLLFVAVVALLVTLGGLWAVSMDADARGVSFADQLASHALALAGRVVLIGVGVWRVSRWMGATGLNTASPAERAAWATAQRGRWWMTSGCVWFVALFFWNTWSDPREVLTGAEIALRVAPIVASVLLVSAGLDRAMQRFGSHGPASSGHPPSPVRALAIGAGVVAYMAVVMLPTMTAFLSLDASRGVLDGYVPTLDRIGAMLVYMLPFLLIFAAAMTLVVWGATRIDAWLAARRKRSGLA